MSSSVKRKSRSRRLSVIKIKVQSNAKSEIPENLLERDLQLSLKPFHLMQTILFSRFQVQNQKRFYYTEQFLLRRCFICFINVLYKWIPLQQTDRFFQLR